MDLAAATTSWHQVGTQGQTFPGRGPGGWDSKIQVPHCWCLGGARFLACRRRLARSSPGDWVRRRGELSCSQFFLQRHQSQGQGSTLQPWSSEPSPA